jgi:acetylornithine deacetylase/succinyl-diaminopimelate desuccinylase-like protein
MLKEDLKRIHGTNERIGVDDFARCVQAYRLLLRQTATP